MERGTRGLVAAVLVFCWSGTGFSQSIQFQDPYPSSDSYHELADRVNRLEDELHALRQQHLEQRVFTPYCCRSAGLSGGAELTLLKPYHSLGIRGADDTDLSFNLKASPRAWLGYSNSEGLGLRARYWQFDHSVSGSSDVAGRDDSARFDVYVLDGELTSSEWIGQHWDVTLAGGLRYVEYEETRVSTTRATGAIFRYHEFGFSGLGPTLAASVSRPLGGGFSIFADSRASVVVGDEREIVTGPVEEDRESDNIRLIGDLQLGSQWSRPIRGGGEFFVRAASEAHYWDTFSGEDFFDGGESVGFAGVSFAVGIAR